MWGGGGEKEGAGYSWGGLECLWGTLGFILNNIGNHWKVSSEQSFIRIAPIWRTICKRVKGQRGLWKCRFCLYFKRRARKIFWQVGNKRKRRIKDDWGFGQSRWNDKLNIKGEGDYQTIGLMGRPVQFQLCWVGKKLGILAIQGKMWCIQLDTQAQGSGIQEVITTDLIWDSYMTLVPFQEINLSHKLKCSSKGQSI